MIKKIRMTLFAPIHYLNLLFGFNQFTKTGKNTDGQYQSLIHTFCISLGRSSTMLSKRITKMYPPVFKSTKGGILSQVNFEKVNQELNEKGYFIFEERLSDEVIEQLSNFAKTSTPSIKKLSQGKREKIDVMYDPNDKKAVRYDYKEEALINHPTVQNLMCDASILNIAQNYLQTIPLVDVTTMWWNTDFQKEPDSEAAQYFHFDMDRIKWLKFFFYLTDVDEEKGPHSFVEGSHRDGGIPFSMTSKGYARLSDEEVSKYYGKDKIKVFTAPKGTIIAEDTRGLHKGTNVINGDRLLFQIQFSNSLFGTQYQKSTIQFEGNDALKAFDQENPRILMNYK
jgi:ectoine hydroxylase-related dioxygenase (phytanoyl-CoA dioxygenase family)